MLFAHISSKGKVKGWRSPGLWNNWGDFKPLFVGSLTSTPSGAVLRGRFRTALVVKLARVLARTGAVIAMIAVLVISSFIAKVVISLMVAGVLIALEIIVFVGNEDRQWIRAALEHALASPDEREGATLSGLAQHR
ncbi:MAG: hypothetical protein AAF184_20945 [Pseudomonadota bacterium]